MKILVVGAVLVGIIAGTAFPFVAGIVSGPRPRDAVSLIAWYTRFNGLVAEYASAGNGGELKVRTSRITSDSSVPDLVQFSVDKETRWRTMDFYFSLGTVDRINIHHIDAPDAIPVGTRVSIFRDAGENGSLRASTVYLLRKFD